MNKLLGMQFRLEYIVQVHDFNYSCTASIRFHCGFILNLPHNSYTGQLYKTKVSVCGLNLCPFTTAFKSHLHNESSNCINILSVS